MNFLIPKYTIALCQEVKQVLGSINQPLYCHTLYFGGGTPSLLSGEQIKQILDSTKHAIEILPDAEITIEANPGKISDSYLEELYKLGINRISFGMQSASLQELKILDRMHRMEDVLDAIYWSKQAGFRHINIDLISGVPGQTLESWKRTLAVALQLEVDHLSVYSLTIENGTPLAKWISQGLLSEPDEDLGADMFEITTDTLTHAGYEQYEISNWSLGEESRSKHNLQYWRYLPYLGFGAGAHGFFNQIRTENLSGIKDYIAAVQKEVKPDFPSGPALLNQVHLSTWEMIQENLMVSLRLVSEGISLPIFQEKYGVSLTDLFPAQIEKLTRSGLIELIDGEQRLQLTQKGCKFGNRVFVEFIGNRAPRAYKYLED